MKKMIYENVETIKGVFTKDKKAKVNATITFKDTTILRTTILAYGKYPGTNIRYIVTADNNGMDYPIYDIRAIEIESIIHNEDCTKAFLADYLREGKRVSVKTDKGNEIFDNAKKLFKSASLIYDYTILV